MSLMEECIDAYLFLKKALEACKNKPVVYVDRGPQFKAEGRDIWEEKCSGAGVFSTKGKVKEILEKVLS